MENQSIRLTGPTPGFKVIVDGMKVGKPCSLPLALDRVELLTYHSKSVSVFIEAFNKIEDDAARPRSPYLQTAALRTMQSREISAQRPVQRFPPVNR